MPRNYHVVLRRFQAYQVTMVNEMSERPCELGEYWPGSICTLWRTRSRIDYQRSTDARPGNCWNRTIARKPAWPLLPSVVVSIARGHGCGGEGPTPTRGQSTRVWLARSRVLDARRGEGGNKSMRRQLALTAEDACAPSLWPDTLFRL